MGPTKALLLANFRATVRDATTLFFTFAFPLIFLIVFGAIFAGKVIPGTDMKYIQSIAPGVLSWGVANAALFGIAFTIMSWRNSDLLRSVRLTPTPIATLLGTKLALAAVVGVIQSILFIAVAMLPFMDLKPAGTVWQVAPLVALGVIVFCALGATIGSRVNTVEAVAAVCNAIMVPMAFLSGAFFPLAMMPEFLQNIARCLPLYYLNMSVGGAMNGAANMASMAGWCGVLIAFGVVFLVISGKTFRWSSTD